MAAQIAALRLGSRVCFEDRWQGRLSGVDVAEDWEVLNLTVSSGFLFAARSVKLPFSAVTSWSDDAVSIAANSFQAFAREVAPVATPSRPVDASTPTSHPGARFAGLIVRASDRRATDVLLSRGLGGLYRIPVTDVQFEDKTLTFETQAKNLTEYHPDAEILERLRRAIAEDNWLTLDDKGGLHFEALNGQVTISGNVRVKQTRRGVHALVAAVPGVLGLWDEVKDDFELETEIGLALDRSGLARDAEVFARSNLGEITLYGSAPSARTAEDIVRTVAKLPGVREVKSQLAVPTGAAAA